MTKQFVVSASGQPPVVYNLRQMIRVLIAVPVGGQLHIRRRL